MLCRGLQFDVFIGFGGVVREAGWLPVVCEVMNDGPAFEGIIEISETYRRQKRRLVLELPSNTRKRVLLPLFYTGGMASWEGTLRDSSGKLRAKQSRIRPKFVAWESVLMGSVSRSFAGLPTFPQIDPPDSQMQPQVAQIPLGHFPDTSVALEALSSLYLNSEQALKLNLDQARALTEWVAGGGHLILAIEQPADLLATEWLHPLSPFRPESVSQVKVGGSFEDWLAKGESIAVPPLTPSNHRQSWEDASQNSERSRRSRRSRRSNIPQSNIPPLPPDLQSALDSSNSSNSSNAFNPFNSNSPYGKKEMDRNFTSSLMPIVTGERMDGEVLLEAEGLPLIVSSARGRGAVSALTFSPEREPFRSWKRREWFWAKLNRIPSQWFDGGKFETWGGTSADGIFASLIETRQVQKLPVQWLFLLLLSYLVLIGPFDYWFLKYTKRQMLTWLSLPGYVVLFTSLIYVIGYILRPGELEWNEFHVVDILGQDEQVPMKGRSFASIYSPANRNYRIGCQVPGATFRSEFLGTFANDRDRRGVIETRQSQTIADVFVPIRSPQLYVSDWNARLNSPISVQAHRDENGIKLSIHNRGKHRIESIGVAFDHRFYYLDGLDPDEKRTDRLSQERATPIKEFISQDARNYIYVLRSRSQALGETRRLHNPAQSSMVATFLSEFEGDGRGSSRGFLFPHGMDLGALPKRGELVVLAYCPEHSPIPPLNHFQVIHHRRDTLYRLSLRPKDLDTPSD